jgi:hypothetical protein
LGAALSLAVGCSSSNSGPTTPGAEECAELAKTENQEFCQSVAAECTEVPPGAKNVLCGVPLRQPPAELTRSVDTDEFKGTGPADVACFSPAGYPAKPGASKTVTISGIAKIFSNGDESKKLTIEVYTVKRTGGEDDGMPDQLIGAAVTTASECKSAADEHSVTDDGSDRYECHYEYPGVPSETELLIKTYGDLWTPLYDYNVYVSNDEIQTGDVWDHNVRALASDDYTVIPQAAMGGPVAPGRGVIAGEIHDCGDVRVMNATVAVDVSRKVLTYFSANEDKPMPDITALGTSRLGLYAALDVTPGPVRVAAAGLLNGKVETLGFFKTRVFADSVTSVTFRGLRPFQVP